MSNLILPENHINPILEGNLKLFFSRYPWERERLEPILRKPAAKRPLPTIMMPPPPPPEAGPARVLTMLGIGNPLLLATVLNDPYIAQETFKLMVVENDPEFLAFCFQYADLTQVMAFEKTDWLFCQTEESIKPALFRILKNELVSSMMQNAHSLDVYKAYDADEKSVEFYKKVPPIYDETVQHVLHNNGNTYDSLLGIQITLKNQKHVLESQGIEDLENHFKGASALIVGAGPSLDQNIETIKKNNNKFVVIAVDAAVKPLIAAGVRVDYVTSIERFNLYQKPFFEGLKKTDAELVAFPVIHPDILALYPGKVRICYRNYSFYGYFQKSWPKKILFCGGSTSHLGIRLAVHMGCSKIFMVGLDSCYEEKDGLFRSHCSGTGYEDWGQFVPLEDFAVKRNHLPPIKAVNNLGQEVTTNTTYYQWCKEYSGELAALGHLASFTNCSATGLAIDGIPFKSLEDAAKSLPINYIEKPTESSARAFRAWDHKELVKNFKGWLELAIRATNEANDLLKETEIDYHRFSALLYINNYRFLMDDLFISFVIQCCARDYFLLENAWFRLPLPGDKEMKAKTTILRNRFVMFANVLKQLVAMFETNGEEGVLTDESNSK